MGFTSSRRQERSLVMAGTMGHMLVDHHYATAGTGVAVTQRSVAGLPAFDAAVGFAAESVAQTTMKVWRGEGALRDRVTATWQSRLFRGTPNPGQDWFTFWYTTEASLTARRNAYVWKTKDTNGQVVALTALHPDQVDPTPQWGDGGRILYAVYFSTDYPKPPEVDGYGMLTVDGSVVHHIRGRGGAGEIIAPSPIYEFATSLGVALAKQEHESSLYRNGVQGGLLLAYPAAVTAEQARKWKDLFDAENAGVSNTAKTKVTGGGATVTQIGMSQVEAQFTESVGLSLADVARITNVPEWFLAAPDSRSKPISPEHEMQRWMYLGLGPRLTRIESSLNADPDLFGAGPDYLAFDTADVVRGDLLTEANISIRKVQAGIWVPDEARSRDGFAPLAGGVGQIPQITPVGGVANDPLLAPDTGGG